MSHKSNQNSLEAIRCKWNRKLKESGFEDIEDGRGRLKHWSGSPYPGGVIQDPEERIRPEATMQYFRLAGFFLHDHCFRSPLEKAIWRLHCEGRGRIAIFKELRKKYCILKREHQVRWILQELNNLLRERYGVGRARHYKNPAPRRGR